MRPDGRTPLDVDLEQRLGELERAGLRRVLRPVERRTGAEVVVNGRSAIDFSSNDYLGLAADPRLAAAAARALEDAGTGAGAARLISGNHPLHERLEREVAAFKQAPAALLFASGYAANTGAIPALVGRGDAVYSDALNHASLIDGCRLSRAESRVFPHLDVDALHRMLAEDEGRFARRMIVVDAVFSMDGDLFPLDRLVEVARGHGAWTYVDDAHGTGVLGPNGRGAAERFGVEDAFDVRMGTLGKALGTAGAFVAGSERLRDWLMNRARPFVFTTGTPPALAAAAMEALRIARAEPWRRERLRDNARRMRDGLAALGFEVPGEADGHIVPVVLGDAERTMRVDAALRARGFLVGAVRPPTVPPGGSRLRITLSAAHTAKQIDGLLDALRTELPAPCSRAGAT
ncbi:8-amino-7-oxononanoate synthase [Longimicrobium sp.]|uniref:8-amino-7-oxononanoate synthase n=1 Tax=Longimicrobium sp. TaxID=2029185 RepID=UPI002E3824DA|nr:8-amino-7-oxononanoate synthase [Longimicrobium sp.]HEX6041390.1 8-amino-7-oxononanoate synthase [Longimicrobium sp.]